MKVLIKTQIFFLISLLLGIGAVVFSSGQGKEEASRCLKCHSPQFGSREGIQHSLIKQGQCLSCHRTYDEQAHKESVKPVDEICLSCHDQRKLGRSHPIGPGVIDPNTKMQMTCVSTCHHPHGSEFKNLLSYKNNMDLCLSCHKDF